MTPSGLARLKSDEGCRLAAYPDPSSPRGKQLALPASKRTPGWEVMSAEPWTCGYGCTGQGIDGGTVWTVAEAEAALERRVASVEADLARRIPWFTTLDPVRQDVLVNIAFNIGAGGLMKWPKTLGDVKAGNYAKAADEIRQNVLWHSQVHDRSLRCAAAMQAGVWA
jgi:lysozyme